jgi:hypothetical protein
MRGTSLERNRSVILLPFFALLFSGFNYPTAVGQGSFSSNLVLGPRQEVLCIIAGVVGLPACNTKEVIHIWTVLQVQQNETM